MNTILAFIIIDSLLCFNHFDQAPSYKTYQSMIFGNNTFCYYCKWCGSLSSTPSGIASCPPNMNRCITAHRDGMILRGCADDKCLPVGLLFSDDYRVIECCVGDRCNKWVLNKSGERSRMPFPLEEGPVLKKEPSQPIRRTITNASASKITATTILSTTTPLLETSNKSDAVSLCPCPLKGISPTTSPAICNCSKEHHQLQSIENLADTNDKTTNQPATEFSPTISAGTSTTSTQITTESTESEPTKPMIRLSNSSTLENDLIDIEDDDVDIIISPKTTTSASKSQFLLKPLWRVFPQPIEGDNNISSKTSSTLIQRFIFALISFIMGFRN